MDRTLEKLLSYYPKKDYWNAHLARLPRKPGFGDRFALDVMRLRLASGTLTKTEEFMEMAQLALQCSERSRRADEAQREVDERYRAAWMESHVGKEFDGTISGVTSFGLFVTLDALYVELSSHPLVKVVL